MRWIVARTTIVDRFHCRRIARDSPPIAETLHGGVGSGYPARRKGTQLYDLIKYVHVLAAIIWVGGAFYAQLLAIQIQRSADPDEIPKFGRRAESIGTRVFIPASIVLFLAGAYLVTQRWSFSQAWVSIAIALWLLSVLMGALYLGPRSKRIGELFAAEGPGSATGRALVDRVFLVSRLELLSFAVIVFLMVVKPGT